MDYYSAVRAFIRVAESGSFTKASDALELPRNTVTKLVQMLEAHLGLKLLHRTTRRVSMTNEGAAYYERMSPVLEEWQEVESELAVAQNRPRGRLRIDVSSFIATQALIPALPTFCARYPDLQLDIGVNDQGSGVLHERVDCLIHAGKISAPAFVSQHFNDLPVALYATKGYLAGHGMPEHPADLEHGHTLVGYFVANSTKKLSFALSRGTESVTVQGRHLISVNNADALLAAGLKGLGILRAPKLIAQPYIDDGRLVPLLQDWSSESLSIFIIYAPNRHRSARVRVFVDWLKEVCHASEP